MTYICKYGPEHRHETVEQGRECWRRTIGSNGSAGAGVAPTPSPTPEAVEPPIQPVPFAMQPRTTVPLPMLVGIPDGYYAVQLDSKDPLRFLRVARRFPQGSVRKGCIQVQTQHSDDLREAMLYRPLDPDNGNYEEWLRVLQPHIEKYIILAIVDPITSGQQYASELGRCMICGKSLTDERSRWYGIGPDCEKSHGDIIEWVNGEKGEYKA